MEGFRSLAEGEAVEFEANPSDKGLEATFVCGPGGADCRGSERRPVGKRKARKIRFLHYRCYITNEFGALVKIACSIKYIENARSVTLGTTRRNSPNFCLCPWLGPPWAAFPYIMHFRFCG